MKALVISGGGSKGAFAGGVAEFLIGERENQYDIFIGTSTGSLLVPHLALGNVTKIKEIYTNVNDKNIFDINPFVIKNKLGQDFVSINHFNILKQFLSRKRTFGESHKLKQYIKQNFSQQEFNELKNQSIDVVVTVTNFSLNSVEYKSINDFDYDDFCNWIWISCNYIPFMSLETINSFEYGDGGFSNLVPIREAINRGATEIDVIVLDTENQIVAKKIGRNPFSLMVDLFQRLHDQVENHDITIGKLAAKNKNVKLNFYYTPSKLTDNALIFNKEKMQKWWKLGYDYAQNKSDLMSENKLQ